MQDLISEPSNVAGVSSTGEQVCPHQSDLFKASCMEMTPGVERVS